jgi:hypothetical protein
VTTRIEVQRTIRAEASTIFNVLTDPDGHVSIDASGMLMSSTGRPVAAVGDTFVVHMDREALGDRPLGLYDVTVKILAFEQGREIAWTVESDLLDRPLEHVYGYRLEPGSDGGTLVTSYYDWSNVPQIWVERGLEFPIVPESALKATLGILARTVQKT